jgi:hypothetical protein
MEKVNDVVTIFAAARLDGAVGGCESGEFVVIFNEVAWGTLVTNCIFSFYKIAICSSGSQS